MIHDQDRAGWFGASDTAMVMGNWNTKTFRNWWLTKLGLVTDHYTSRAMNAGTYYERAILDYIGSPRRDHQILLPEYLLRVNLDGDGPRRIDEVKTHRADKPFKVTKAYWQQVQVQTFAKLQEEGELPAAQIISYGLLEDDYKNFFNEIEPERVGRWTITYDPEFISEYLGRLERLRDALLRGVFPE